MNKRMLARLLGYLFSVLPPVLLIVEQFPILAEKGGEFMLSGLGFLLLLVAAIPLRRGLSHALRHWLNTPSAFTVWGAVWLFTAWFGRIAATVADIALVSMLSSLIGAAFFRLAGRGDRHES